jgi:hypothetical protein
MKKAIPYDILRFLSGEKPHGFIAKLHGFCPKPHGFIAKLHGFCPKSGGFCRYEV